MNEPDSVKLTELKLARAESWKPFAITVLVVLLIAVLASILAREHIGIAANLLVSLLCLLPLVIVTSFAKSQSRATSAQVSARTR